MPSESVAAAAASALEELLEVSPQVDAAIILERDGGRLISSAPATIDRRADRLAATCVQLLEAADRARNELGREPVSQVEVATPDGHVFVVADATWIVAAVTTADPTVGLVFYDLKTALRSVRETTASSAASSNGGGAKLVTESTSTATGDDATASGDDAAGDDEAAEAGAAGQGGKWRRKKS